MANTKSSKKRVRTSEKSRQVNRKYISSIKTLIKKYKNSIELYKGNPSSENLKIISINLRNTFSTIDKACKRNIIHSNNAAHKKSKLSLLYNHACV